MLSKSVTSSLSHKTYTGGRLTVCLWQWLLKYTFQETAVLFSPSQSEPENLSESINRTSVLSWSFVVCTNNLCVSTDPSRWHMLRQVQYFCWTRCCSIHIVANKDYKQLQPDAMEMPGSQCGLSFHLSRNYTIKTYVCGSACGVLS